jgi:hypothetical protein
MVAGKVLDRWLDFCAQNDDLQQFGQPGHTTDSTYHGHTGCTHTILQRLIKAYTGDDVTHDQISVAAGYPWPSGNPEQRGLFYNFNGTSEIDRVFRKWKLPYKIVGGLSFDEVHEIVERAPVMLGIQYLWWPENRGTVYNGQRADGKPGGFAYHGGKTQLTGFTGRHAVLYIGGRVVMVGKKKQRRMYANDPNHGSASRPEKPNYDAIAPIGLQRAYEKYGATGLKLVAWVPTKSYLPKVK